MSNQEILKEIVSQLYQTPASAIGPDFPLRHQRLQGSAGRGLLVAAIRRRLGVYVGGAVTAGTYGELATAVCGGNGHTEPLTAPSRSVPPAISSSEPAAALPVGGLSVGIDMELVENLPDVADFWMADFYKTHFTGAEIAYCIRQEQPRMHFAARWCAKEALRKCDAALLGFDPATIQVALDASGRPSFEWNRDPTEPLPHALSLTHTPLFAAAVVAVQKTSR